MILKIFEISLMVLIYSSDISRATSEEVVVAFDSNISSIVFPSTPQNILMMPYLAVENVTYFELDVQRNCLFYSTVMAIKIYRKCGSGIEIDIIAEDYSKSLAGFSYDWKSGALYFVSSEYRSIELIPIRDYHYHTSNALRRPVIRLSDRAEPRDLIVNPLSGFLFWSDMNVDTKSLWRANLDGSNARAILRNALTTIPTRLAIDFDEDRIYWIDFYDRSIARCDFDGGHLEKFISDDLRSASSFAVGPSYLYWFNDATMELFIGHKGISPTSNSICKQIYEHSVFAFSANGTAMNKLRTHANIGYMSIATNATETGSNGCDNGNLCTYMCVGGPNGTYGCLCPAETDFECADKLCMEEALKCDGNDDCGDNSDEENCNVNVYCSSNQFRCPFDGRCIARCNQN